MGFKKIELDADELQYLYHNKKKSLTDIAEIMNCSTYTVRRRMKEYDIGFRSHSELLCASKGFAKSRKINSMLHQILDGILLSDGYYSPFRSNIVDTSYLVISQCKQDQEWLYHIKKIFEKSNIESVIRKTSSSFQKNDGVALQSMTTVEFGKERKRWYQKNCKTVPRDITVTPMVLAYWYMGDGHLELSRNTHGKRFYRITLCSQGFPKKDVLFLQDQLYNMFGFETKLSKAGDGFNLRISQYKQIKDFLFRTYPYKISCFNRKWKALTDQDYTLIRKKWDKTALKHLKKYPKQGNNIPELIQMGFSRSAITQKANKIGYGKISIWDERNIKLLKDNFEENGTHIPELIKQGISKDQIQKRAIKNNLKCAYVFNQYGKFLIKKMAINP
mgnify:CR=1 FL=1